MVQYESTYYRVSVDAVCVYVPAYLFVWQAVSMSLIILFIVVFMSLYETCTVLSSAHLKLYQYKYASTVMSLTKVSTCYVCVMYCSLESVWQFCNITDPLITSPKFFSQNAFLWQLMSSNIVCMCARALTLKLMGSCVWTWHSSPVSLCNSKQPPMCPLLFRIWFKNIYILTDFKHVHLSQI